MSIIRSYLTRRGYSLPSENWYVKIQEYLDWYKGAVENFHNYSVYNGTNRINVHRYSLGMAKVIAEDHASLLLNERVKINVPEAFSAELHKALERNNFRVRSNRLVELAYALGTGALVEYRAADGQPVIDYINATMIFPLSWDNGKILECAFGTRKVRDKKQIEYLQLHLMGDNGYIIENIYLDSKTGEALTLPPDLISRVETKSQIPLFQIVQPNIINNCDLDSPMGISVYGNSISELKAVDLIWDSYINEFVLGRKRVMVPMSMAKIKMAQDGVTTPLFDPNDTAYYVYEQDSSGKNELKELNMTIRAEEHEAGLQRALNMLSKKCGLGNDRYQFNSGSGGVRTATEVISEKSELFQNLQKNELLLEQAIVGMTRALAFLSGLNPNIAVTVAFDDSIIEDRKSKIAEHVTLTGAGLESKRRAIMEIYKLSEIEAEKELKRISAESTISGTPDDWYGGDAANESGTDTSTQSTTL